MNRRSFLPGLTCATCVLVLCAGCGSPNGEASGTPQTEGQAQSSQRAATPAQTEKIDPHDLITVEEAKVILSWDVKFTDTEQLGQFASMRMENEAGNIIAQLQVSTIPYTKEVFQSEVAESAKLLDAKFDPVEGLGEGAYWMDGLMQAFAKGRWVQATVIPRPGLDAKSAARAVLEKAIANLP